MNNPRTWILLALLLGAAATTILPDGNPDLPGRVELIALEGPGVAGTEHALAPFARYLGLGLRRSVGVQVVAAGALPPPGEFELALMPARFAASREDVEVLAWSKPHGLGGADTRPLLVHRRGLDLTRVAAARIVVGDAHSFDPAAVRGWLAEQGLPGPFDGLATGSNPYDHSEALAALVHGAYDLAVVRESDLRQALDAGLVDRTDFAYLAAAPAGRGFALVAGPGLPAAARGRVRDAALNLDHLRYDPQSLRAHAVLEAMGKLGLDGFVPVEMLPSLRP